MPEEISPEQSLLTQFKAMLDEKVGPLEAALKQKATNNLGGGLPSGGEEHHPVVGKEASEGTGIDLGRLAILNYQERTGRLGSKTAAKAAAERGYHRVARSLEMSASRVNEVRRSLSSTSLEAGGVFVETEIAAEVFKLLQPLVWIRNRADKVPLAAGLDFNKETGEGTAYYKGELQAITPSQPTYGMESMVERELTALVPISNRLLQLGGPEIEAMVRDMLLRVMAKKENLSFYRGDGTSGAPKGIRNRVASSNRFSETKAGATATLDEVRADLHRIMLKLTNNDVPMGKCAWFMSPQTKAFLSTRTDANGNAIYEAQLAQGMLLGYPVDVSTQVPTNLGGSSDETEVGFVDYSEVIIGQGDMFLNVFPDGTYEMNGQTISGVSRNQTPIRAIQYHDLIMRHTVSGAFMQGKWVIS